MCKNFLFSEIYKTCTCNLDIALERAHLRVVNDYFQFWKRVRKIVRTGIVHQGDSSAGIWKQSILALPLLLFYCPIFFPLPLLCSFSWAKLFLVGVSQKSNFTNKMFLLFDLSILYLFISSILYRLTDRNWSAVSWL